MNRIYQGKYKEKFIEKSKGKELYEWLFDKTFDYEVKFGKDLFNFNKEQLLEYLGSRNMTIASLKTQINNIRIYIRWANNEGLRVSERNAASEITDKDLEKIAKPSGNVMHKDEIDELVGNYDKDDPNFVQSFPSLKNAQDRLLIYLIFMGVCGNQAKELTELRFKHIDNGLIKLSELDPYREDIRVGDKNDTFGMELIEKAKNEKFYERYQNENRNDNNDHDYDVDESDYVFRKSNVGRYTSDEQITYSALLGRLSALSKHTGEKLTMKQIEKSGMVYIGKLIMDMKDELKMDDPMVIKSIFKRYDIESEQMRRRTLKMIREEIETVYNGEKETV